MSRAMYKKVKKTNYIRILQKTAGFPQREFGSLHES